MPELTRSTEGRVVDASSGSVSRRSFFGRAAGAVAAGAGGCWAVAAVGDDEWTLPVLGDLHIDRPEHHDPEWLKANHPGDVRQVENYSRVTRDWTPRLLDVVRRRAADSKLPVPFVAQLGDLVEGLCGSEDRAATQARDAVAMVRDANFPAPLLFCKGNHDVAGPGAAAVYDRVLVPFLAAQAGEGVASARFTRTRGGTLVVFYDAYDHGSLDWFEGLLRERKPDRVLFLIHPPVVPYTARSTWHVYSSAKQGGSGTGCSGCSAGPGRWCCAGTCTSSGSWSAGRRRGGSPNWPSAGWRPTRRRGRRICWKGSIGTARTS
jgi:hypothetical protein